MLYTNDAIKTRQKRELTIKNVINIIIYIIILPLLVYNILVIVQAVINPNKTPSFLGIKSYVIISGSMQPNLDIGDVVVVKDYNEEKPQKGDIISFRQGHSVVTHRINEIIEKDGVATYKTKGDNNNIEDSETIKYENIEGKVIKVIPKIGKIILTLKNKTIIIAIMVVYYIYLLHGQSIRRKKENRRLKREKYESNQIKEK